jgi:hypothetical protein
MVMVSFCSKRRPKGEDTPGNATEGGSVVTASLVHQGMAFGNMCLLVSNNFFKGRHESVVAPSAFRLLLLQPRPGRGEGGQSWKEPDQSVPPTRKL